MKFIITVLMLIPLLTLSQLRVILGKDTINLKDPSDIQRVVDSINTSHYKIYELERKRIEDSSKNCYFSIITLFFLNGF
jgi:hypothetical protein